MKHTTRSSPKARELPAVYEETSERSKRIHPEMAVVRTFIGSRGGTSVAAGRFPVGNSIHLQQSEVNHEKRHYADRHTRTCRRHRLRHCADCGLAAGKLAADRHAAAADDAADQRAAERHAGADFAASEHADIRAARYRYIADGA